MYSLEPKRDQKIFYQAQGKGEHLETKLIHYTIIKACTQLLILITISIYTILFKKSKV